MGVLTMVETVRVALIVGTIAPPRTPTCRRRTRRCPHRAPLRPPRPLGDPPQPGPPLHRRPDRGGTASTIPTPMLNVRRISASLTAPMRASSANTRGGSQVEGVDAGIDTRTQDPVDVARQPTTGDVGHSVHGHRVAQFQHRRGVDHRRRQQLVGHRVVGTRPGRIVETETGHLEDPADERASIRCWRRLGDGRPTRTSPGATASPVITRPRPTAPTREADQVELTARPWHRGARPSPLRPGHSRPDGTPRPHRRPGSRPCRGRARPPTHSRGRTAARRAQSSSQIVDAHRHQVDADGVVTAGRSSHHGLGAHTVGGGHQHRVGVARRGGVEETPESAQAPHHTGPMGGRHRRSDATHRFLAGVDADPSGGVGLAHARRQGRSPARPGAREGGTITGSGGGTRLEHVLAQRHGDVHRVVTGETGIAEPAFTAPVAPLEPIEREVARLSTSRYSRISSTVRLAASSSPPRAGVHAVEAGPPVGRRRDAHVDLGGTGLAQHLHHGPGGGASHDGVVDHHQPPTPRCCRAAG